MFSLISLDPFKLFSIAPFCSVWKFSLTEPTALFPETWHLPPRHRGLSWVEVERGKASQTAPGDPTWTLEMPLDGGGRSHPQISRKLSSHRQALKLLWPGRLRGGKACSKETKQSPLKKHCGEMPREASWVYENKYYLNYSSQVDGNADIKI